MVTSDPSKPSDADQETALKALIGKILDPVVAFSGGVDSSYLLAVASEALGPTRVRAVLGVSPSVASHQIQLAREIARGLGVTLQEVATEELERPEYRANAGNRCYFCKDTLFTTLAALAPQGTILEGTNLDDLSEHRPGRAAASEHRVRSPLVEVGLTKAAIRRLSRARSLPTADLPSSPCLASRFPAGEPVTESGLRQVEAGEALLRELGFSEMRLRHHGSLARIEVPRSRLAELAGTPLAVTLATRLRALGYLYVTLDLEGFRSGSSSHLPPPVAV